MFTAGHFWSNKGFRNFTPPIEHNNLFCDSGAFQLFGRYSDFPFTPEQYLEFINSLSPDFFATMDYPCEPFIREKIHSSVKDCIDKTIENTAKIIDIPSCSSFVPVLQGWNEDDYVQCIEDFKSRGLLTDYMAVGTLCRRGDNKKILSILRTIKRNLPQGCKLHGFGVKISLLKIAETYNLLESCDSAAWVSRVRAGELTLFTGKKLVSIPYSGLPLSGFERLSISVNGYVGYVEYLINQHTEKKGNLLPYIQKGES